MITYERKLDMTPGGVPLVLYLNQYDNDFTIKLSLYSSNGSLSIQSGTVASIRGSKKDGGEYLANVTLNENVATVSGDSQMTNISGISRFEISLQRSGKELNSANFFIDIEPSAMVTN